MRPFTPFLICVHESKYNVPFANALPSSYNELTKRINTNLPVPLAIFLFPYSFPLPQTLLMPDRNFKFGMENKKSRLVSSVIVTMVT